MVNINLLLINFIYLLNWENDGKYFINFIKIVSQLFSVKNSVEFDNQFNIYLWNDKFF